MLPASRQLSRLVLSAASRELPNPVHQAVMADRISTEDVTEADSGSEAADVPKPKRIKRDRNLSQLKQGELAPSSVTWGLLHLNGDVPDFSELCSLQKLQVDGTLCKGVEMTKSMMELIRPYQKMKGMQFYCVGLHCHI